MDVALPSNDLPDDFPSSHLRHLITRLVIARAAAARPTNPKLADEYRKLAVFGCTDPSLYWALLRCNAALAANGLTNSSDLSIAA